MATDNDSEANETAPQLKIDDSNPFGRDPSLEMVYGSGGRDIAIREPVYGENEGKSVEKDIGEPGSGGPVAPSTN